MSTLTTTRPRGRAAMGAARTIACVVGLFTAVMMTYFVFFAPDDVANWRSPWIDFPVIALKTVVCAGYVLFALAPGLSPERRMRLGLGAVALDLGFGAIKLTVYDEVGPATTFAVVDAVIAVLLWLGARHRMDDAG